MHLIIILFRSLDSHMESDDDKAGVFPLVVPLNEALQGHLHALWISLQMGENDDEQWAD